MRPPLAGRRGALLGYRRLGEKAIGRRPKAIRRTGARCSLCRALWRRGSNRTPEACGNALAGEPKSRRGTPGPLSPGRAHVRSVGACGWVWWRVWVFGGG